LNDVNNEAKVRRTAKAEIVGTARVMSYEDLELARRERAIKTAAEEAKKAAKEVKKAVRAAKAASEAEKPREGSSDSLLIAGGEGLVQRRAPVARM